ncbi:hypothetical protein AMST5_02895 [freshwater sediment metagenome]|uniref:ATPase AAA-type core domain-containing protein n=1 Tax=freshwater sediment metagenome TaxID=556182 RepID=A0AA48M0X5_9ZZZZ
MPFDLSIPLAGGQSLDFLVDVGQIVFVLGANGTGKSSLMQRFFTGHRDAARRISAHRQTWFASASISMTGEGRRNTEQNILHSDLNPQSRWKDDHSAARASVAIYDLVDAQNVRARAIADAVDNSNIALAQQLAAIEAPVKIINELLRFSNLPIEIFVHENEQVLASKSGGPKFSVSELSDGERNALLIAANILTVKPGTIVFVDEPERHLHRSIISPLLTLLFAARSDCAFVISTHDVMLPLDNPTARTLLVRGCKYEGSTVREWDADLVTAEAEIDDALKQDILGARRKLLFVEGSEQSLDKPLYSLIFPNVSVVAKSTCRDVEHAVSGIRDAQGLHWLHAFGIVDNDRRVPDDIVRLRAKGVYALSVFSVEAIYYHTEIQRRVAERHCKVTGADPEALIVAAQAAALDAVRPHIRRLSERAVEAKLRKDLMKKLPRRAEIAAAQRIDITIDVPAVVAAEVARLQSACDTADLSSIICCYPIRETPALGAIARNLQFQSEAQYESAVRKLLMDDAGALAFLRALFDPLPAEIDAI